ncbi:homeobox KN domain-containing protein [Gongronella butleri]|nr:homeobox KN domain-containing protein [Gongronella butleri]
MLSRQFGFFFISFLFFYIKGRFFVMPRHFCPTILFDYTSNVYSSVPDERKEQIHNRMELNGRLWIAVCQGGDDRLLFPSRRRSISNSSSDSMPLSPELASSSPHLSPRVKPRVMCDPPSSDAANGRVVALSVVPVVPPSLLRQKRRGNLPKQVTATLKQWLLAHIDHPYPSEIEKAALQQETQLTMSQISNWFINARRRIVPYLAHQTPQWQPSYNFMGNRTKNHNGTRLKMSNGHSMKNRHPR